ncbi:frizzled/smoothened-like sans crd protein g, partial [Plakobranchus ocellatus]
LLGFDVIYIIGTLSLDSALLVLPLPETHKERLPDTIAEMRAGSTTIKAKVKGGDSSADTGDDALTELRPIEIDAV